MSFVEERGVIYGLNHNRSVIWRRSRGVNLHLDVHTRKKVNERIIRIAIWATYKNLITVFNYRQRGYSEK